MFWVGLLCDQNTASGNFNFEHSSNWSPSINLLRVQPGDRPGQGNTISTLVMNSRKGRAGADLCLLHCPFPPRMEIHDKDLYLRVPCLGQSLAHSRCSVNIGRINENIQHKKIQIIKILECGIIPSWCPFSSVQFSRSVVSDSLRPHESQHARPPCPSPAPGVHPNSCPSSQWCHPAISSSVIPFSSCPQSLPASESFPMSQLFTWGGQSTRVSALASFLPKKSQDWSPLEWTGNDNNQINKSKLEIYSSG